MLHWITTWRFGYTYFNKKNINIVYTYTFSKFWHFSGHQAIAEIRQIGV